MAFYDFRCDACNYQQEIEQSMQDPFPEECPECGAGGGAYHQDYAAKHFLCRDNTPKTVMQQAERNAREGGELYRRTAEEVAPARKKAPTPWWRKPGSKPLDLKTVRDVKKYVETGDKS